MGLSRRDFLRVGTLSAGAGLALANAEHGHGGDRPAEKSCILLFLVGGPSQLDTWDPKPLAPEQVRGPFRPIQTNVPGIQISENFPLMARMADRYAIIRSVHHREAPVHETGQQLMQTGRVFGGGPEYPHYGAVLSHLHGARNRQPAFVVLPTAIGNTGIAVSHGQGAGFLGEKHEPQLRGQWIANKSEPDANDAAAFTPALLRRYGPNAFGRSCLLARSLVERGVRLVTVNMFDTVYDKLTWDCHAEGVLPTTLQDYRTTVCPMFDRAYSALLSDLQERGMLESTLVAAMGEFGRTPELNARGGRDHWPGVWSILLAGGGVRGGQVIGRSDRLGAEPSERPVTPAEVAASIYRTLGVDLKTRLPGPEGAPLPLVDARPIEELF